MKARVLHFGWDDCHRIEVLRSAGCEVRDTDCLDTFRRELEADRNIDAVVLSEDDRSITEQAAQLAHDEGIGPVILFRRFERDVTDSSFDRVYPSFVPPTIWLADMEELISRSRAVRECGQPAKRKSQESQEATRRLRARFAAELER